MLHNYLSVGLLNAQVADETTSEAVRVSGYANITVYIIGAGTLSSGVITIEQAFIEPRQAATYTGTWSAITTVNATDVTAGQQKAIHLTVAAYNHIRTRISTVIGGGGTISTALEAC